MDRCFSSGWRFFQ